MVTVAIKKQYYECPDCSCYHAVGYNGSCDDFAFLDEELDEMHGIDGWEEIENENRNEPAPEAPRRRNYDRMMAITEDTDIHGKKLESGCRVRCFGLTAIYDPANDWLLGMDDTDCYYEGELLEIVDHYQGTWLEGRYYAVAITIGSGPVIIRSRNDFESTREMQVTHYRDGRRFPVYTPVNGQPREDGARSFNVVRVG